VDVHVQAIADLSGEHSLRVAVAKSLTSGALARRLGAGREAAEWFRGVGSMAVLAIYLRQRGSAESKPVGEPHSSTGIEG
jgi:hypothetical protein